MTPARPSPTASSDIDFLAVSMPERSRPEIAAWVFAMGRALGASAVRDAIATARKQSATGELYDAATFIEMAAAARAFRPASRRTPIQPTNRQEARL